MHFQVAFLRERGYLKNSGAAFVSELRGGGLKIGFQVA